VTPFLVGLLFPLAATGLDIGAQALSFSLDSLLTVQQTQPLHWLIDLVPLVMWLVAGKSGPPPRSVATGAVHTQEQRPERSITTLQTELATVKKQLDEVQARELAARMALDNIQDAIFILTVEGTVTDVNRGAEQALGWSRKEMVDHPIRDLLMLSSVPRMEAHCADIVTNPALVPFCEVEFVHSNGRSIWAEGSTSVLRNEAGEATGLLVTYRDLSHRQPSADRSASPPEITVPVQEFQESVEEPQREESSSPSFSYQVTDSGALSVPGLFAEHPQVGEKAEDEPPIEFSFQEASFATLQEPVETRAVLSSEADTEPVSFVSSPRFTVTDESETPLTLARESVLTEETVSVAAAPDASAEGEIYDFTEALAHVGGDEELLAELAGLFLQEYQQALENLRVAVDRGDAEGIMYHAHALRGSVSNFVSHETENAARRLEQIGREGNVTDGTQALNELETALQRLIPALTTLAGRVPV
jgi:PAS domain S-box-containing protein